MDPVNLASFFTTFKNQFPTQYNRQVSTAQGKPPCPFPK